MRVFVHVQYPARVVLAPGALARVPDEVARLTNGPVLLIASGSAREAADRLAKDLGDRTAGRIDGVRQHVPAELAVRARAAAADTGARVVVSIGGGSATGLAKAVALTSGLPVLAVPTTYAGSEMTPVWGLTEAGAKRTGTDPAVLPRTVVYDPELSRDLPLPVTAASTGNALAHCIEAVWTPAASPLTELIATEGVRVLSTGLRQLLGAPADLVARSNLLYGACLAGVSLAQAGTGLHHKLCHWLGGRYGLPHAQTHAVLLPHVTALNAAAVPDSATRLASAVGAPDLALGLFGLFREAGLPAGLRELGLAEVQAREAADAMAARPPDNPVPLSRDVLRAILARAWAGDSPA